MRDLLVMVFDKQEYNKQYYENNKEHCKQKMKEYQQRTNYGNKYNACHKEQKQQYDKNYYQENKETIKERSSKYYTEHRKQWNQEHAEERKVYMKQWHEKNKDKSKAYKREYFLKNYEFLVEQNLLTDCIICGFPKEKFAAIDFHHINPEEKEKQMSPLMRNSNPQRLLEEARKCVCMCRNCHSLYHSGDEDIVIKYNEFIRRNKNANQ